MPRMPQTTFHVHYCSSSSNLITQERAVHWKTAAQKWIVYWTRCMLFNCDKAQQEGAKAGNGCDKDHEGETGGAGHLGIQQRIKRHPYTRG
mmetsp:Transcript_9939/g.15346  ORF Transcript_9939/g.15346 Transcript_9939/m.15346 type:complete len:91 (-) Transcript_9939:15-287(-)